MSKILKQIEGLGLTAAQCDLWAAQPETHYWEKAWLRERAAFYREEQAMLLEQNRARTERWREIGVFWLTVWDVVTSPTAKDCYAGAAALTGLVLVVEIALAIFGHPLFK